MRHPTLVSFPNFRESLLSTGSWFAWSYFMKAGFYFGGGMGGGGGRPNQSFIFNEVYKYYPDTVIDLYAGFGALFKLGV